MTHGDQSRGSTFVFMAHLVTLLEPEKYSGVQPGEVLARVRRAQLRDFQLLHRSGLCHGHSGLPQGPPWQVSQSCREENKLCYTWMCTRVQATFGRERCLLPRVDRGRCYESPSLPPILPSALVDQAKKMCQKCVLRIFRFRGRFQIWKNVFKH